MPYEDSPFSRADVNGPLRHKFTRNAKNACAALATTGWKLDTTYLRTNFAINQDGVKMGNVVDNIKYALSEMSKRNAQITSYLIGTKPKRSLFTTLPRYYFW